MSDATITLITGLLFVFALSAFIWPIALGIHLELEGRKKLGEPPQYDERQKLARQRAGNHAMYVLLTFLVLWAIVNQIGWFAWTNSILDLVLCALILTWCVWASDCILHDGFASWKNKQKNPNAISGTYSVWIMLFVRPFCAYGITASWMPYIFTYVNIAVLCIVLIYKARRDKKAAQEEDAP
ncbi:MAG: hypothetical protein HDT18_08955 [Oscillibacter sp.]|nr:hypothetical protein [Oscillibacter sp.]